MPSVLTPDFGLLFWMVIAFLTVFILLAKFGFPAIVGMVEKRKQYIDESLASAREANEKLANIKVECKALLEEAKTRQSQILKDATLTRDQIIADSKLKAQDEANRIISDARRQIQAEMEKAQLELRTQVADLSIQIAAKVLSRNLEKDEQQIEWIDRILSEMAEEK